MKRQIENWKKKMGQATFSNAQPRQQPTAPGPRRT